MNERETLKYNSQNHLEIGGVDCFELAKQYRTPLYVYDKNYIEQIIKAYVSAINDYYGFGNIYYASKAFCCKEIYRVINKFNIGADIVSGGELYTALSADFPSKNLMFHGNNKLYCELEEAVKANVKLIVVDSFSEAEVLNEILVKYDKMQDVLIRVNPGVEAHTHKFIQTATPDSKFGFSISNGDAYQFIKKVLSLSNLNLKGLHCHIGSQIFDEKSFITAVEKMIEFYNQVKIELNFDFDILDLGGGFGIWYNDDDKVFTPNDYYCFVKNIAINVIENVNKYHLKKPYLILEPGRSIVGEAGITLYTVGSVKEIPNVKNYLAIDGGMFDNPRYILYQAKYTVLPVDKTNIEPIKKYTVVGKCCESGDIIAKNVNLPEMKKGDLIAVLSTGAYNYSMASNYNRNIVPQVVFVENGKSYVAVKRQTYDDLIKNDL